MTKAATATTLKYRKAAALMNGNGGKPARKRMALSTGSDRIATVRSTTRPYTPTTRARSSREWRTPSG
jgi:hypothetical protein